MSNVQFAVHFMGSMRMGKVPLSYLSLTFLSTIFLVLSVDLWYVFSGHLDGKHSDESLSGPESDVCLVREIVSACLHTIILL